MKTLTPSVIRKIVQAVIPDHIPNYDRGELNVGMWGIVLNFAHYAGFDVNPELARVNSHIKDEWMKLSITPIEDNRATYALMDGAFGGDRWLNEFEQNLAAVMAL